MGLTELAGRLVRGALIGAVRLYQLTLSRVLPPSCRFEPSCSQYMIEAIAVHGACRGLMLGAWRVLRCNPWGAGGYDPVPGRKQRPVDDDAATPTSGGHES